MKTAAAAMKADTLSPPPRRGIALKHVLRTAIGIGPFPSTVREARGEIIT